MSYVPPLPDVDTGQPCAFCEKYDKAEDMYIATLVGGIRVYPIDPENYVLLCWWCAHYDSKAEMETAKYAYLDELIYESIIGEGDISDYNGIL